MIFPTSMESITARIEAIDPEKYATSRNYKDGALTYLSPYISRGVISTRHVYHHLLERDLSWNKIEKLVQELAWRDYWQQVWVAKGDEINSDLKSVQTKVVHHCIPKAITEANTGIQAVDSGIAGLINTGYMHNHMRIYVASIACNIGNSHWFMPAQWMYGHLLDGDWASNALSWQWVAGSNANKKYIANQENINKYFYSTQRGTYLDRSYESLSQIPVPDELKETTMFQHKTRLPATKDLAIDLNKSTLIYTYYNMDPKWRASEDANRILHLDTALFQKYPVSDACIDFVLQLSKNIKGIQLFKGTFKELEKHIDLNNSYYKEHPTTEHYSGIKDPRDWMFPVKGYYSSFFKFWKKCKKHSKQKRIR